MIYVLYGVQDTCFLPAPLPPCSVTVRRAPSAVLYGVLVVLYSTCTGTCTYSRCPPCLQALNGSIVLRNPLIPFQLPCFLAPDGVLGR